MKQDINHYDTLELTPDASPDEIRDAYLRMKSTYNKDCVALYTLVNAEEREQIIHQVEDAYHVLSSPEKRKEYDRCHGLLSINDNGNSLVGDPLAYPVSDYAGSAKNGNDLLVAPATDFAARSDSLFAADDDNCASFLDDNNNKVGTSFKESTFDGVGKTQAGFATHQPVSTAIPPPPPNSEMSATAALQSNLTGQLLQEVTKEIEWRGDTLRKIRELKRISIEEVSSISRITKAYIVAIEEENYSRLPAAVYLRGFLIQISKILKVPQERVVGPYLERYQKAKLSK